MRYMLAPYGCGRIHLSLCVFFLDKIAIYKIEISFKGITPKRRKRILF